MTLFITMPPNISSGMKHSPEAKRLPSSDMPRLHSATISVAGTPAASFSLHQRLNGVVLARGDRLGQVACFASSMGFLVSGA